LADPFIGFQLRFPTAAADVHAQTSRARGAQLTVTSRALSERTENCTQIT